MDTVGLDPGQTIRIFDYSPNPRALLSRLSAPIGAFVSAAWFPVLHVRRGWLHGSHAVVTVRPPANYPASRSRDLTGLAAAIGGAARELAGTPPLEADYVAAAEELGRWENVPGPYLPLRPQGHIEIGVDEPPAGWPSGLVLARDLMLARLLTPTLAAAGAASDHIAAYAMRVLALAAATHPGGVEIGTLPYRSHSEAMLSWDAGPTDLRATFATRLATDRADFATALADPIGSAAPGHADSLRQWAAGVQHCWGIATALALSGQVDRSALNNAGRLHEPPRPLHAVAASPFHDQMHSDGFDATLPYWHVAHRMVVNVLYQSLSCLGLTPLQRYYLCYGLSEATDTSLGQTWSQRLSGYASGHEVVAVAAGSPGRAR